MISFKYNNLCQCVKKNRLVNDADQMRLFAVICSQCAKV